MTDADTVLHLHARSRPMTERTSLPAHADQPHSVAALLATDLMAGLSSAEASRRLEIHGANSLEFKQVRSNWRILLTQFSSIVIWLLAAAAAVAFLTGSPEEAIAITVVLVLNASI